MSSEPLGLCVTHIKVYVWPAIQYGILSRVNTLRKYLLLSMLSNIYIVSLSCNKCKLYVTYK